MFAVGLWIYVPFIVAGVGGFLAGLYTALAVVIHFTTGNWKDVLNLPTLWEVLSRDYLL